MASNEALARVQNIHRCCHERRADEVGDWVILLLFLVLNKARALQFNLFSKHLELVYCNSYVQIFRKFKLFCRYKNS